MTLLEGFERKQRLRSLARKLLIGSFKQRSDMCARRAPHATLKSTVLNAPLTPHACRVCVVQVGRPQGAAMVVTVRPGQPCRGARV